MIQYFKNLLSRLFGPKQDPQLARMKDLVNYQPSEETRKATEGLVLVKTLPPEIEKIFSDQKSEIEDQFQTINWSLVSYGAKMACIQIAKADLTKQSELKLRDNEQK